MNKSEFISKVAEKAEISKADAKKAVDAFAEVVKETLKSGDKIQLIGFGTFETVERSARTGRNPQTGEIMEIPASLSPKFKAGAALKEAVK